MWVDSLESEKEKPGKGEKVHLSLVFIKCSVWSASCISNHQRASIAKAEFFLAGHLFSSSLCLTVQWS